MLVLKIIGALLILLFFLYLIFKFNNHCDEKFGHIFFSKYALIIITTATLFFIIGSSWHSNSLRSNGDTLNGIILMIISAIICVTLILFNIKSTNFLYGFLGSLAQIVIFGVMGFFGILALILFAIITFAISLFMGINDRPYRRH